MLGLAVVSPLHGLHAMPRLSHQAFPLDYGPVHDDFVDIRHDILMARAD